LLKVQLWAGQLLRHSESAHKMLCHIMPAGSWQAKKEMATKQQRGPELVRAPLQGRVEAEQQLRGMALGKQRQHKTVLERPQQRQLAQATRQPRHPVRVRAQLLSQVQAKLQLLFQVLANSLP